MTSAPTFAVMWLVALSAVGCHRGSAQSASEARSSTPSSSCTAHDVQVVAHADDDLLFMNPDVMSAIREGRCTTTVVVTAGDAGHDATYWTAREEGIREAYARMAGVVNAWTPLELPLDARPLAFALRDAPRVRIAMLRLPDGNVDGSGFDATGHVSLERMWRNGTLRVRTVDDARSFTREELTQTLASLIVASRGRAAGVLRTLDGTGAYGHKWSIWTEHSDHALSARFANEAAARAGVATTAYRGYNIASETPNLSQEAAREKRDIFLAYARHDSGICEHAEECSPHEVYEAWIPRRFTIAADPFPRGALIGIGYRCLAPTEPNVTIQACDTRHGLAWEISPDGHVSSGAKRCLAAPDDPREGAPLAVVECAARDGQRWKLGDDGHLVGASGLCAQVHEATTEPGTVLELRACVPRLSQTFEHHLRDAPR